MKRFAIGLLALGMGAASVLTSATAAAAHDDHTSPVSVSDVDAALVAKARAATARYHNVNVAIADGFVPTSECAALPGVGGMGYHYVNFANLMDGVEDVTKPDILMYIPTRHGVKLGGIEYMKVDSDQDLGTDDDRPSLFGVAFDGPMPGHDPSMPIHYDLHVWLWQNNPDGLFAPWNPRVSCTPTN